MDKVYFEKLETVFHRALEIPAGERRSYLTDECAGNPALLSEVEALIRSFEQDPELLEKSVLEFGLSAIQQSNENKLNGQEIGFYRVEKKIGAGGMGDVYKAFDTKLNRFVALKFLSEETENDVSARRQLIKEAQAAALLDHPNICSVYGIEEFEGQHFIVMQFIEGKTLDECLKERKFSTEEFKEIAGQIIKAVAFAHSHGIIHRDLKPGNIMLNGENHVKILDFGLAKILRQKSELFTEADGKSHYSQNGLVVGTPAYMSPEQVCGERIDFRSDIFSLGIIFFELLTGKNPYKRTNQAETIAALLEKETPKAAAHNADVFPSYAHFVEKCLRKNQSERFQSAAEMLVEFAEIETQQIPENAWSFLYKSGFRGVLLGVLAVLVFSVVYFLGFGKPRRMIAVLPITTDAQLTDKEYLGDGLTQGLIEKFSNLSELKVANKYAVANFKNSALDPQEIGKKLSADAVFTGVLSLKEGNLMLSTKLIKTSDNYVIESKDYQLDEKLLNEAQDQIAAEILAKLRTELNEADKALLARQDTENNDAKLLYIRARHILSRRKDGNDLKEAIGLFREATELDPAYAKAWAGLADANLARSNPGTEKSVTPEVAAEDARSAIKRALEINPNLCEIYNSLGMLKLKYDWNREEAKQNFNRAIECDPDNFQARINLSSVYRLEGKYSDALQEIEKAKEIDSFSISPDLNAASVYYYLHDFEKMGEILETLKEKSPKTLRIAAVESYRLIQLGKFDEAIEILQGIYNSDKISDKVSVSAPLGFAYAKSGERAKALNIIEDLKGFSEKNYVPSQEKGIIYIGLKEYDKAFESLKMSCGEKFSALPALLLDPLLDDIKNDGRFQELKACAKL